METRTLTTPTSARLAAAASPSSRLLKPSTTATPRAPSSHHSHEGHGPSPRTHGTSPHGATGTATHGQKSTPQRPTPGQKKTGSSRDSDKS